MFQIFTYSKNLNNTKNFYGKEKKERNKFRE